MTSLSILDLPIRDIDVPANRARDFDQTSAEMLAGVIAAQGLHHPIRVRPNGDRYTLISGLLRLRAFELLQRDMIPASVSGAATDASARLEEALLRYSGFGWTYPFPRYLQCMRTVSGVPSEVKRFMSAMRI